MKKTAQSLTLVFTALFAVFFVPELTHAQVLFQNTNGSAAQSVPFGQQADAEGVAGQGGFSAFLETLETTSIDIREFSFTAVGWMATSTTGRIRVGIESKSTAGNFYVFWCGVDVNVGLGPATSYATTTCNLQNLDFNNNSFPNRFVVYNTEGQDIVVASDASSASGRPFGIWMLGEDPLQSFAPFQLTDGILGVATSTAEQYCEDNFPFDDSTIITATITYLPNGLCRIASFMFIPPNYSIGQFSLLASSTQQKIPFSYFYDLSELYDSMVGTSSATFTSVDFDISSTSVKNTAFGAIIPSVNAFSTTTISTYISPSVLALLRGLMVATLYLGFAYMAFRRVSGLMHKTT